MIAAWRRREPAGLPSAYFMDEDELQGSQQRIPYTVGLLGSVSSIYFLILSLVRVFFCSPPRPA